MCSFFRLIYGFFRIHLGFHVGFLIRISCQHFFGGSLGLTLDLGPRLSLSRVSFRIQTGTTKENANKETIKTRSTEAKEQEGAAKTYE